MTESERNALNDLIGSRAAAAIFKMKDNCPRYQKICKKQEERWENTAI
jgi:hypothetical protein